MAREINIFMKEEWLISFIKNRKATFKNILKAKRFLQTFSYEEVKQKNTNIYIGDGINSGTLLTESLFKDYYTLYHSSI